MGSTYKMKSDKIKHKAKQIVTFFGNKDLRCILSGSNIVDQAVSVPVASKCFSFVKRKNILYITLLWIISRRAVRASDCQCQSRNSPGFNPSILRYSESEGRHGR